MGSWRFLFLLILPVSYSQTDLITNLQHQADNVNQRISSPRFIHPQLVLSDSHVNSQALVDGDIVEFELIAPSTWHDRRLDSVRICSGPPPLADCTDARPGMSICTVYASRPTARDVGAICRDSVFGKRRSLETETFVDNAADYFDFSHDDAWHTPYTKLPGSTNENIIVYQFSIRARALHDSTQLVQVEVVGPVVNTVLKFPLEVRCPADEHYTVARGRCEPLHALGLRHETASVLTVFLFLGGSLGCIRILVVCKQHRKRMQTMNNSYNQQQEPVRYAVPSGSTRLGTQSTNTIGPRQRVVMAVPTTLPEHDHTVRPPPSMLSRQSKGHENNGYTSFVS